MHTRRRGRKPGSTTLPPSSPSLPPPPRPRLVKNAVSFFGYAGGHRYGLKNSQRIVDLMLNQLGIAPGTPLLVVTGEYDEREKVSLCNRMSATVHECSRMYKASARTILPDSLVSANPILRSHPRCTN